MFRKLGILPWAAAAVIALLVLGQGPERVLAQTGITKTDGTRANGDLITTVRFKFKSSGDSVYKDTLVDGDTITVLTTSLLPVRGADLITLWWDRRNLNNADSVRLAIRGTMDRSVYSPWIDVDTLVATNLDSIYELTASSYDHFGWIQPRLIQVESAAATDSNLFENFQGQSVFKGR